MKINTPVTNTEILFEDSQFMLTKTDLKGVITYANQDFVNISGFTEEELIGSGHNLVRHPDMPVEAFQDMWRNLKTGKPWTGLVKNRTKSGDFYWVEANATPIFENNQITGYLSVRRKPTRQQVDLATNAYRLFKDGQAKGFAIVDGKVVRESYIHTIKNKLNDISVTRKILSVSALSIVVIVAQALLSNSATLLSLAGVAVAVSLIAGLGFIVSRSITKPLQKSMETFAEISQGNLASSIDASGNNEVSRVLQSLKSMQTLLSVNENTLKETAIHTKEKSALYESQLAAIAKSTGVIEFSMDGKVIGVNDIFLNSLGYNRDEAIGLHHSAFVEPDYRHSSSYKNFWDQLNYGEAVTGEFKRVGKNGKEIWLQASYNPILTASGKPYKVVKYATDITLAKLIAADNAGQLAAIGIIQGVIEFDLSGKIITVNENFATVTGYSEKEIVGNHHSMFLDSDYKASHEYKAFWEKLALGKAEIGQYKRIGKGGKEIWLQASYNPIMDMNGKPFKVVKYATDITSAKLQAADNAGQLAAISKIQGVIAFDLAGKIIEVNENFAAVTGYSVSEIIGKDHSMFVDSTHKANHEYKAFWEKLARGEADSGQYKRIGKGGMEIWLQASYNPIMDMNGKPFKVVKYATDITEQYKNATVLAEAVEETKIIIESAKAGDLSSRVSLEGKTGSIASLCDGVNALMDKMTEIIIQVREAGETINSAAGEISTGNNDLSSRTEQQASSLEETAASMEELASTVKNNAENAKQANQLSVAASGVAVQGGKVVHKVVKTMSDINESAKKIEDIISVIDGIAFQTNILALNAAVEAARAGEQGRGFAVVAGEVRNLAQRSSSAAKEIKELITDSVNKTADGTRLVEDAGKTMDEIVTSVQRVTDIMAEITAASSEQSTGIDQVNQAITSMDEVTQQNAALVEQAAAASESLVEQSSNLMETVSVYQLTEANHKNRNIAAANVVERNLTTRERRSNTSLMRNTSQVNKQATKFSAKTGTSDEAWEEF
jgi:methyl-accepting chemotaxis protein